MKYSDKLKDPRWQKKRLQILEAKDWQCQICQNKYDTLHVHHSKYEGEPWDIEDFYLYVLCDSCHAFIHSSVIDIEEAIAVVNHQNFKKIKGALAKSIDLGEIIHNENIPLSPHAFLTICIAFFRLIGADKCQ